MVIGIGTDIIQHELTRKLKWECDLNIQQRLFSVSELEIYNSNKQLKFLAGRFAAKEAIIKCLGVGMIDGISMSDIEILQDKTNKPFVSLNGYALKIANQLAITKWHVSISHSPEYSIAFAIGER